MAVAGRKGSSKASAKSVGIGVSIRARVRAAVKPQNISGTAHRRDTLVAWALRTDNYSIEARAGLDRCPACTATPGGSSHHQGSQTAKKCMSKRHQWRRASCWKKLED